MSILSELVEKWCREPPLSPGIGQGQLLLETDGGYLSIEAREISEGVAELSTSWPAPDWLVNRTVSTLPSLTDLANDTEQARVGLFQARSGPGVIQLTATLYLDGLSRHSFMLAVSEIARAYLSLRRFAAQVESQLPDLLAGDREFAASAEAEQAEEEPPPPVEVASIPSFEPIVEPPPPLEQPAPPPTPPESSCQDCGALLSPSARFCVSCGTPVYREPAGAPPAPPPCRNCGAPIAPDARFCVSCGTPIS